MAITSQDIMSFDMWLSQFDMSVEQLALTRPIFRTRFLDEYNLYLHDCLDDIKGAPLDGSIPGMASH
jgi:hypothetical protein